MNPSSSQPSAPAPSSSQGSGTGLLQLIARLRGQQRRSWMSGERRPVESFIENYPLLRQHPEAVVDLIYSEYLLREELGEVPGKEEYQSRFPQQAQELSRQLELHQQLQGSLFSQAETAAAPRHDAESTPHGSAADAGPSQRVDVIVRQFEDAWESQPGPQLDSFLPNDETLRVPVLIELVHVDLEYRMKAGESVRVESYIDRFPELQSDPEIVLELIAAEYEWRRRRETDITPQDYLLRFPQFRDELSRRLNERMLMTVVSPEPRKPQNPLNRPIPEVAGYEILGELGRGGMGVVYKARQVGLKRIVALKMILHGGHASAEDLERFKVEAEAVARLQHPNIVQVYEIGEADGKPYFSLEYCDGGSLAKKLQGTLLPPAEAAELMETLARAVHAAHQRGIIHRDLKPANILLVSGGVVSGEWCQEGTAVPVTTHHSPLTTHQPKITDFGLAKKLDEEGQTATGAVMGTPSYMAPEQAFGKIHQIGPATDTYALGAILYECLTGRPPFKGETLWDTLDMVKQQEPLPPGRLRNKLPADLETICLKCLHKEPKKRYATSLELADDLRRWRSDEPIKARPTGWVEKAVKWTRRHPARAAVIALTILLTVSLLGGGAYHLISENQRLTRLYAKEVDARSRLQEARALVQDRSFDTAEVRLSEARSLLDDGSFPELKNEVEALLASVQARQKFLDQFHQATFHLMLAGESDATVRETDLKAGRQAAKAALAEVGLTLSGTEARPSYGPAPLDTKSRQELVERCYELLLGLAEAAANDQGEPDQRAAAALALTDRAASLGLTTRSLHVRRALFFHLRGDQDAAAREAKQAQTLQPILAMDWFLLGLDAMKKANLKQARAHLVRALEKEPNHYWAHYHHAVCDLRLQRYDAALANLDACLALKKDFTWAYLLRGFAHAELAEFESAETDYAKVEEQLSQKPFPYAEYGLHVNRGLLRFRQNRLDDAVRDLQSAIALRPDQYPGHVNLADIYKKQADALANEPVKERQKLADALASLDKAISLRPAAELYRKRAQLHLRCRDDARALPDLEEAIRQESRGSNVRSLAEDLVDRGRIFYRAKKFHDAHLSYDLAAKLGDELTPKYLLPHRLAGEALLELGQFEKCVAAMDQYLQKGGEEVAVLYRARGLARSKTGDYGGAVEDFSRSLDLDRLAAKEPNVPTLAYRGWAYLLYEAPGLALRDFEQVLKLMPHAEAHNGRGLARVKLGKYREGVADAEKALALGPKNSGDAARLYYNAARVFAQAAAKAEADSALQDRPRAELRQQYLDRAVQNLAQALSQTDSDRRAAFWKEYVQADPALAPARRTLGFVRLAGQYGQADKSP